MANNYLRVWWCPTGPFTVLPLHAAGLHPRDRKVAADSNKAVIDRVISSYTPTLTALSIAPRVPQPAQVNSLTVGLPATPGLPPLPAVPEEMRLVARYFPPDQMNHQLSGPQATRKAVLASITSHSWLHMACHAFQHGDDQDRSGFALFDGTLTITDLAGQQAHSRDLAFLSASQTAAGSGGNFDEAIHLPAALQSLGFGHVIASMWAIADVNPASSSRAPFMLCSLNAARQMPLVLQKLYIERCVIFAARIRPIRSCGHHTYTSVPDGTRAIPPGSMVPMLCVSGESR